MEYEILIVGAGPAGLSTGLHLAQMAPELAARTLILEKEHHPRPKLCAGGVLPAGEACLRGLGLDMREVPSETVDEIVLQFEGFKAHIRGRPVAFRTVRREQFDAWLADAARARGLALREGVRVLEVRANADGALVRTDQGDFQARVVVGADGARGVVRRSVSAEPPPQVARLVETRLPDIIETGGPRRALFDFSWLPDGVQGYLWDFPTPAGADGQVMRTWGVYDSRVYRNGRRGSLKETLDDGLARHRGGPADYTLEGHPLRWLHPRAALSTAHVILVGDAAGTDSVVGEGISFALGYGEVAARAIQEAYARDDFRFRDYRRRVLRHRTGRYLRRRALGARLLYGIRNRFLLMLVWGVIGPLASAYFIDWTWESEAGKR